MVERERERGKEWKGMRNFIPRGREFAYTYTIQKIQNLGA